jgi:hypothetical protein
MSESYTTKTVNSEAQQSFAPAQPNLDCLSWHSR